MFSHWYTIPNTQRPIPHLRIGIRVKPWQRPRPTSEIRFDLIKRHGATELEIEILKAYFDLDSYMREKLLKHFKERLKIIANKPNISTVAARPSLEDEARAEAEEYYRAILAEKEAAAGLSASPDSISGAKLA